MKVQRFLIAVTIVNLGILMVLLFSRARPAQASGAPDVLRGRALEIVDDHGRVRASIKIQPAEPDKKMPNGRPIPENVILRLIDPAGRPEVKLGASVQGAGLGLVGETDAAYVVLEADLAGSSLKLVSKNGRQQLIKP